MPDSFALVVDGEVEQPLQLTFTDLQAFPAHQQVLDVSRFHAGRPGDGVVLEALLERARPRPAASYLTLHADRDDFHASVPLAEVRGEGIVVYRHGGSPLAHERGGPVRFIVRDPSACHTSELDDCANVKHLCRIELTDGRGRDTRPTTEAAHKALHRAQEGGG